MPEGHSKTTIISMAVLASATATLLHEGVGHGLTAWLRGSIPLELTSNHLSSMRPDRWVEAGGTLVNLFVGAICLWVSRAAGNRANFRYFFWILAALNLLLGAGYFLFSGIFGFGDWQGAALYVSVVRLLAVAVRPFCPHRQTYNIVGRLPYYAACLFSCAAGAFDPLGVKLFLVSTVPAAFGGSSGLMWADSLLPAKPAERTLLVSRRPTWWIAAAVLGLSYIVILGRGIQFAH